jgi:mRNA-degrading endonuclease toxin of MazEF toxin-antitoxin module
LPTLALRETRLSVFRHDFETLGFGARPMVIVSKTSENQRSRRVHVVCSATSGRQDALAIEVTSTHLPGVYPLHLQPHNLRTVSKDPRPASATVLMPGICESPSRPLPSGRGYTAGYIGSLSGSIAKELDEKLRALITGVDLMRWMPTITPSKDQHWRNLRQWDVIRVDWLMPPRPSEQYVVISHDGFHSQHPHHAFLGSPLRPVHETSPDLDLYVDLPAGRQGFRIAFEETLGVAGKTMSSGSPVKPVAISVLPNASSIRDRGLVLSSLLGYLDLSV